MNWLQTDDAGITRCWWPGDDPLYVEYHDNEWGLPVGTDNSMFEKMCLEGFQSGLSWITILRKRENFRAAFAGFDIPTVAAFGPPDVERMLADAGIVRHRGKIESSINNARRAVDLLDTEGEGALARMFWEFEPAHIGSASQARHSHASLSGSHPEAPPAGASGTEPVDASGMPLPAVTPESTALSKALKKRGFSFVGPTTMYAHMQATGIVNDHLVGCVAHAPVEAARAAFARPERNDGV